jgi:t-SNARE complex subunit (syntaxin)
MTESLLSSNRQDAIQSLEQDIHRLHESMTLLHELIRDQQPAIDTLEEAITYSKEQARSAQQDLQHAEEYQASSSIMNRLLVLTGMAAAAAAYLLL